MKPSILSRPNIKNIIPYEPGKPISEVEREYNLKDVIKLASNENPRGPSPKAIAALTKSLSDLHLYPDGGGYYLKQKLSDHIGIAANQIVLGNGSAEIVELITEAFVDRGDEVVIGRQAFFKYRIAVQIMDGTVKWAEMPDLQQDAEALIDQITDKTKLIFIANPNNPTGTLMDRSQVNWLMDRIPSDVIVIFDEAYYDYRNEELYPDSLAFVNEGRNIIVLRTFSKSYGLAGIRIGYALTTPEIAHSMNAVREAFNVNSLAMDAAMGALDDNGFLEKSVRMNVDGKELFYRECYRLGLQYVPSEANFILINVPLPGRELFLLMLHKGVVIRPVDVYDLPYHVRVSIGLPHENEKFFYELESVLKEQGLSLV